MQKLNLSDLQHQKSGSQITVEKIHNLTSFPLEMCNNLYESMSFDMDDKAIVQHFVNQNKQQLDKINTQKNAIESLDSLINYDISKLNETSHQNYFMNKFRTVDDVYTKLNITKELLQNTDGNDVGKLAPLFEGIQHDLAHTSKNYQPDNMFNIIMDNINRVVQQNELKKVMVSDDNIFYLELIKTIFEGSSDTFYTNISNIENTISDKQTLLFDLIIFTNKFIQNKEYDLKFINSKTVREYNSVANELVKSIFSSSESSRLLNQKYKDIDNKNPYNVITQLTGKIDEEFAIRMGIDLYNIPHKSVYDSIRLIDSIKHLFKQPKIRKLISLFVTKSNQLVTDVDKAVRARKMAGY